VQIIDAVIDAATRQFSAKGTAASIRDIARDAGVNVGLVHRHVGNKDDLLRAVLARLLPEAIRVVDGAESNRTLSLMAEGMPLAADYVRIVTWLLLSGEDLTHLQSVFPVLAHLAGQAGSDEHLVDLLTAMALLYGWQVFGEQLVAGAGRPDLDPGLVRERLGRAVHVLAGDLSNG
jgi:AcrR family transcriptional regulator